MGEIWKDIEGYEGLYQVSNLGRVKSFKRKGCRQDRILKCGISPRGYHQVTLSNGIQEATQVHRLIALHFIPNPENKRTVNHINGIKTDNRIENLEWCTYQENNLHAYKTGLKKGACLGKFGKDHNRSKPVLQYSLAGKIIAEYAGQCEAERKTGIQSGSISLACRRKLKTAGGFMWGFKN